MPFSRRRGAGPPHPPPAAPAATASDTGQGWHVRPRSTAGRQEGRAGPGSPAGKDTGPVGAPL